MIKRSVTGKQENIPDPYSFTKIVKYIYIKIKISFWSRLNEIVER